jgi:hypothetical protein
MQGHPVRPVVSGMWMRRTVSAGCACARPNPWTLLFSPVGSQIGLANINRGTSSQPAIEPQVLSDVASYGKQLGRIGDALLVLLRHFQPVGQLTRQERRSATSSRC